MGSEMCIRDRLCGVHEAGHAVASCIIQPGALVAVTLRPARDCLAETTSMAGRGHLGSQGIRRTLTILLAGRAAEEIIFGEVSDGSGGAAGSDLAVATVTAATAIGAYGFDRANGLVWSGIPTAGTVAAALAENPTMSQRVRSMLDDAYSDAVALLRPRRSVIEAMAATLVARRVLDGSEAAAMVEAAARTQEVRQHRRRSSRTWEAVR